MDDATMPGDDCNPPHETPCTDNSTTPVDECHEFTCSGGTSPMTDDVNRDGTIDDDDCIVNVQSVTIVGPTTPSSVEEAQVGGAQLEATPSIPVTEDRSTAVRGVQVERAAVAAAPLARTGASTGLLSMLGVLLLALGAALVRFGGRRPETAA
ncbi:MAG TPA: hypothetical protein VM143_07015 [Acidimicrobiales bacterium]|nr:hypothetical protein [Acidimicrobiales bacterium]